MPLSILEMPRIVDQASMWLLAAVILREYSRTVDPAALSTTCTGCRRMNMPRKKELLWRLASLR